MRGLTQCSGLLAGMLACATGVATAGTVVGRVNGDPGTTPTGAATYAIPIEVAAGMNGLGPGIALAYNSQAGRGEAGAGWSLTGFSTITRCPRTQAVDGRVQGVRFSRDDRFCLDDQPLVLMSGTHGAQGAQYRTEVHGHEVVTSLGSQGSGPLSFELRRPDGLVYRYGNDADSRIEVGGGSEVRAWALNEVEDRFGQRMAFRYAEDSVGGEYHPVEILWTFGAGETPAQARYRLSFSWEMRPAADQRSGFVWGMPWRDSQRLSAIEYAHDPGSGFARVHHYALAYAAPVSGGSTRSLLASITQCGPNDCLPPTTFQWNDGQTSHVLQSIPGAQTDNALVGDFNGDGATDIFTQANGYWAVQPADPQTGGLRALVAIGGNYTATTAAKIIDYNGDGLADLMLGSTEGPNWLVYQSPMTPGEAFVVRNTGVPWSTTAVVLDIDGDGLDDLAYVRAGQVWLRRNTGGAFAAEQPAGITAVAPPNTPSAESATFIEAADFDGDGRSDLLITRSAEPQGVANYRWEAFLSTGTGFGPEPFATFTTAPGRDNVVLLDINGDGLTDLLRDAGGTWLPHLSRGTGSAATPGLVPQSCPTPASRPPGHWGAPPEPAVALDYNGDGYADILQRDVMGTWRVHLANGACMTPDGEVIPSPPLVWPIFARIYPADIDGDGNTDVLYSSISSVPWSVLRHVRPADPDGGAPAPQPGLLHRVADGLGNTTAFSYLPLSQFPGYGPSGTNPLQTLRVRGGALPVLSRASAEGASGYQLSYAYSGGRRSTVGRGFLGFETVRTLDSRSGLETVSQFRQEFPFTGRIRLTTVRDQDRKVSTYEPAWTSVLTEMPDTARFTYFVHLASDQADSYEVDPDGGQRGSLVRTTRRSLTWNLAHGAVSRELTEVSSPMSPGQVFRTTRNVSFDEAARANGCLALPNRVDVTQDVSGAGTQTRSVLMTYSATTCRLITQTSGPESDPARQLRTTYAYDANGRTESITRVDAIGALAPRVTRFTYASRSSRPVTEAQVISGERDLAVGHAWNEALGLETGRSDPQGMLTGWQLDDFGRIRVETRSTGITRISYTACGPCFAPGARYAIRETRGDNYWSETQHDSLGRVVGRAFVLVDGLASRELLEYDALGRLQRRSAPFREGSTTRYWTSTSYDLAGRAKSVTRPASAALPAGAVSTYSYAGLDTTLHNAAGQTTVVHHDAAGHVTRVTAPLGSTAAYAYDAAGLLTSVVDAGGNTRRYTYDERGLLMSSEDPDAGQRSFGYDAFGQVVRQADGRTPASVVTLRYDQLGRIVSRDEPEGRTSWTYLANPGPGRGLLQKVVSALGPGHGEFQEYYLYNSSGLLRRTTTVIDEGIYQSDYAYGAEGKISEMTYPATIGWRPRFLFGYANGHLSTITQEAVGMTPVYTLLEMDAQAREQRAVFGANALEERNTYDDATGRLTAIHSEAAGFPVTVQDYSYEWDPVGNLASRRNRLVTATYLEQFTYDDLNRLVRTSLNGTPSLSMTYSADGNILSKSDVGNFAYGGGGQRPHAVTSVSGGPRGAIQYAYDDNGNMTARGTSSLAWTSFNLPSQVSQGADTVRFSYGPGRSRVMQEQATGQASKTIHYVGPHFEVEMEGGIHRYRATVFAYGRAVYSQVETTPGGLDAYYVLHDHLGSVDRLVRAAGDGLDLLTLSFDAWGKRRQVNWSPDARDLRYGDTHWVERGFTGHEHLDGVRLVHMNGRLEDPLLGRMLSPDPILAGALDPQALNPYSYVNNNPTSYFDPSGFLLGKLRKAIRRAIRHVGSFTQRLVRNWGRPVAAAVAAYYTAGAVSSWAYAAQTTAIGATAGTTSGVVAANTLTAATVSSTMIGGAAGGAVAGVISTGNLRGVVSGALTGGMMSGIGAQFGSGYSAGRVLAEATVGGIGAELQGGDFRDGFIASGTMSSLTWAALEMRQAMVEQSRLNGDNARGISDGFRGDRFKLGGCRSPCTKSLLGGEQGGQGYFFGNKYQPGSFLDHLIETYAGPHDYLNSPIFYNELGNNVGRSGIFQMVNAGNVLVATPFAAASAVPAYAYGAFDD